MNQNDKLAVVTGAGSGIGAVITRQLLDEGWHIAANDIRHSAVVDELRLHAEKAQQRFFFKVCDVGSKASVNAFFSEFEQILGMTLGLLVNNAGVQTWSGVLDLAEEDWDRVINTNLKGCFLNTQAAAKAMVKAGNGGVIVNIGSGCNTLAFPKLVDYSASKGGIEMFTKVSAVDLGEHGVRVNCVAPGGIMTERTRQESANYEADWQRITPLGRVGKPEDIANAVSFFASPQADFVTGQTLYVDGGAYSKANWPY